jgi:hypothetical protein
MNLAFPAFLVFLLILPGLIFRYAYARGSWGWASPTSAKKISDEITFGIVGSLVLHAIGIFSLSGWGIKPDLSILLAFLTGNFGPNDDFLAGSVDVVASNHARITAYFLLFGLAALGFGTAVIFVSHDLAVVRTIAARALVMKDGEVREEGETERLFLSPQDPYTRELLSAIPDLAEPAAVGTHA